MLILATLAILNAAAAAMHRAVPRLLSETGLYSNATQLVVAADNRPFSPQYPLWSDGAIKRRWIRLPPNSAVDATNVDDWSFPAGTRFWKEFAFGGRRVETRMLVKIDAERWEFASYLWNDAQTDAALAPVDGLPDVAEIAPGKRHSIPSVEDCRACHDSNRTEPLGFTALQLSDDRDPNAPHAEPLDAESLTLRVLMRERLLRNAPPVLAAHAPRIPGTPLTRAALGYLSANCGACHNTKSSLAPLGLSFRQPAYGDGLDTTLSSLRRRTKWDRPGAPPETTRVIDDAAPELSALLVRMKSRRPASQMPPLGSVITDHRAFELVSSWVRDEVIERR